MSFLWYVYRTFLDWIKVTNEREMNWITLFCVVKRYGRKFLVDDKYSCEWFQLRAATERKQQWKNRIYTMGLEQHKAAEQAAAEAAARMEKHTQLCVIDETASRSLYNAFQYIRTHTKFALYCESVRFDFLYGSFHSIYKSI